MYTKTKMAYGIQKCKSATQIKKAFAKVKIRIYST